MHWNRFSSAPFDGNDENSILVVGDTTDKTQIKLKNLEVVPAVLR